MILYANVITQFLEESCKQTYTLRTKVVYGWGGYDEFVQC